MQAPTVRFAKSIEAARQLLAEAGYPGGQDSKGNPLIVSFDNTWNSAGATSQLMWMRNKLGTSSALRWRVEPPITIVSATK